MEHRKDPAGLDISPAELLRSLSYTDRDETILPDHNTNNGYKGRNGWGLSGYPAAMVYAPLQLFRDVYDTDTALKQGTLFAELDLPFETNISPVCSRYTEERGHRLC